MNVKINNLIKLMVRNPAFQHEMLKSKVKVKNLLFYYSFGQKAELFVKCYPTHITETY